jgi:hypothetical protein
MACRWFFERYQEIPMQLSLDTCFAGVRGLGPLVSQHPISRSNRFGKAFLALVCFGTTLILLNLTAERSNLANNPDSPTFAGSGCHELWIRKLRVRAPSATPNAICRIPKPNNERCVFEAQTSAARRSFLRWVAKSA